jgi:hypothetical protein
MAIKRNVMHWLSNKCSNKIVKKETILFPYSRDVNEWQLQKIGIKNMSQNQVKPYN